MKRAIKLFSKPYDLDEIEKVLQDDSFISLAFIMLGFEDNWRASLDQMAELQTIFEDAGRDTRPIYGMACVLIQRAETFDDTGKFLDEITVALGLLPGTKFMEEIKMAHLHKIDPLAWQREKNRLWVENYTAQTKAMRSAHEAAE